MQIDSPNILTQLSVSGSGTVSGSLNVSGTVTAGELVGGLTGTAESASYVEFSDIGNKPALVSGSSQVSFTGISDKPTLVSGSSQISLSDTDGFTSYSGSVCSTLNEKVNTADIVNNLTSEDVDKPLSANQGKVLQDSKEPADSTILKEGDVEDSLNSTSTTKPLSANQGKQLNDDKASLSALGSMSEQDSDDVDITGGNINIIVLSESVLFNRDIDTLPVSDIATRVDYRNGNTVQKKRKVPRSTTDRVVYKLVTGSSGGQGQGGWEICLIGVGQRTGSSSDRQRIEKWLVSRDLEGNFSVDIMGATGTATSAFTHNGVSDGLEIILRGSVSAGLSEGGVLIQVTGMRAPQNRGNPEEEWTIEVPSL